MVFAAPAINSGSNQQYSSTNPPSIVAAQPVTSTRNSGIKLPGLNTENAAEDTTDEADTAASDAENHG